MRVVMMHKSLGLVQFSKSSQGSNCYDHIQPFRLHFGCMYYELTDHFIVKTDANATWDFFSRAENLPDITPPWLKFTIKTPAPVIINADAVLDYTISWMGVPIGWRTRIIDWSPPHQFIDLQIKGPYTLWHHQHTFTPSAEGTVCTDRVIYKIPVPVMGRIMQALVIRNQLLTIFRYRRKVITERLGWVRAVQDDVQIRPL